MFVNFHVLLVPKQLLKENKIIVILLQQELESLQTKMLIDLIFTDDIQENNEWPKGVESGFY
jgi:hypothetical protein